MLSLRLTRKLEGLSGEALAHLEAQADLLLTMPEHCRPDLRPLLHLVAAVPTLATIPPPRPAKLRAALVTSRAAVLASTAAVAASCSTTPTDAERHIAETYRQAARTRRLLAALRRRIKHVGERPLLTLAAKQG